MKMNLHLPAIALYACLVTLTSCAKIPVQSVALTESIYTEGKRMHELNRALINSMFNEKKQKINDFILNTYTPQFSKELLKQVNEPLTGKEDLPQLLSAALPVLTVRLTTMYTALETNRAKLLTKLNDDFSNYQLACLELQHLLESAVRLNGEKKKLLTRASDWSGRGIDFDRLDQSLNQFITNSGDLGKNITDLDKAINQLIR